MTTTEVAVVIGGAFLGYWVISAWLGSKPDPTKWNKQASSDANSANGATQHRAWQEENSSGAVNLDGDESIHANWFHILAVAETAEKDEIAVAYRQKIRQYHPDKVANMGPELRELAEVKTKQINAAYDYAMRIRG